MIDFNFFYQLNYFLYFFEKKKIIGRNFKYAGAVYLFVYDYEEKQVIFNHKIELMPLLDSFDLPQLNDQSNLCVNNLSYSRKGVKVEMLAKINEENGNCETSFAWSVDGQFNFKGLHVKHFADDQNYSDVRALDADKKFFYFNQKEYLNKCAFAMDIKRDLVKPVAEVEKLVAASKKNANLFEGHPFSDLGGETVRIETPDLEARDDCFGHFDYGRGVFPYKTNWFWTWGQGTVDIEHKDGEVETAKLAVNFGGALSHPDHMKSNEDYFKLNNRVIRLHPVEMVYDKLNHMNGFVFRTAEEFKDRETQTVDLVFTSNHEHIAYDNFVILMVSGIVSPESNALHAGHVQRTHY